MKKKRISLVMALALVLTCVIGGTLAWLTAKTDPVVNTFTVGDINITLTETTGTEYKMVPGNTITKDPKVTVEAGSEACWLFVKVDKSENFASFMEGEVLLDDPETTDVVEGWTALAGQAGVYYREVAATTADVNFAVLNGNQVTVKSDVTKADLNALTENTYPTLTFTAYAIQKDNFDTPAAAWAEASK